MSASSSSKSSPHIWTYAERIALCNAVEKFVASKEALPVGVLVGNPNSWHAIFLEVQTTTPSLASMSGEKVQSQWQGFNDLFKKVFEGKGKAARNLLPALVRDFMKSPQWVHEQVWNKSTLPITGITQHHRQR